MNPKDFDWGTDQQVTVQNPTSKTHSFQVHSKFYEVGPNETVRMPGFMAWVFVYTLALELAQKAGEYENKWNDITVRQKYYNKVIVGADELIQKIEPVEEPSPIEKVDNADTVANQADQNAGGDKTDNASVANANDGDQNGAGDSSDNSDKQTTSTSAARRPAAQKAAANK